MFCVSKWLIQLVFWKVSPCTTKKLKNNKTKLYYQISELREKFHFVYPIPFLVRVFLVPFCYNMHKPLKLPYSSKFQIGSVPWGEHRWDRENLGGGLRLQKGGSSKRVGLFKSFKPHLKRIIKRARVEVIFLHCYEQISGGTTLISFFAF